MKYIFSAILFALLWLLPTQLLAAYTFTGTSIDEKTISFTLSGTKGSTSTFVFELYEGLIRVPIQDSISRRTTNTEGILVWRISELKGQTTYTGLVREIKAGQTTGSEIGRFDVVSQGTASFVFEKLKSDIIGNTVALSGKIDPKIPNFKEYKIKGYRADTRAISTSDSLYETGGIADDGTYKFIIPDLTPGKTYYFKQIFTHPSGQTKEDGPYDLTTSGINLPTKDDLQANFDRRSYRLLAPFPGLSVMLDPDLCIEQNKAGKPGEICDLNDFLNFALKIMIGVTAVFLVIKLMIHGYEYIVTDTPFKKASSKGGIITTIGGLLLAMSSFVILNTINPTLVSNNVEFGAVGAGVDEDTDTEPIYNDGAVTLPTGTVAACTDGIVKITTKGGVFYSCKNIAQNVTTMINTAWDQGIKISGGGFRTKQEQIRLRVKNCGGNTNFNIYEKASSACKPPTARPGRSNHESGLAFDFRCEGASITTRTNKCFQWLQANAKNYGLINFSKEPWHWSVNGK